jgi:hypothetical protein
MGNMGYCRFENTLSALRDCLEHLDDDGLSESEDKSRARLIRLCAIIGQNDNDDTDGM